MSESENILRRLKEQTPYTNVLDGELMKDAAAAMEALRAENEKLRAELREADVMLLNQARTIRDYQDAAAALKETGELCAKEALGGEEQ